MPFAVFNWFYLQIKLHKCIAFFKQFTDDFSSMLYLGKIPAALPPKGLKDESYDILFHYDKHDHHSGISELYTIHSPAWKYSLGHQICGCI